MRPWTLRSSGLTLALMTFVLAGCSNESYCDRNAGGRPQSPSGSTATWNAAQSATSYDTTRDPNAPTRGRSATYGSG